MSDNQTCTKYCTSCGKKNTFNINKMKAHKRYKFLFFDGVIDYFYTNCTNCGTIIKYYPGCE